MGKDKGKREPCPCNSCQGSKLMSEKAIRDHLQREITKEEVVFEAKKRRLDDYSAAEPDTLHKGTLMTGFLLCIRLLMLYNKFSGISQKCMDEIIQIVNDVLGNLVPSSKLPKNFKSITTIMNKLMTPVVRYTACPEECELFKGNVHNCKRQTCAGRDSSKGYLYLPLIPRLQQLYRNPEIAEQLQNHTRITYHPDEVHDIHESPSWKNLYGHGGFFDSNSRGISLQYSADGFQPFHHTTTKPYSIEQQASVILNLPPDLRTKPGLMLLHGLVPGPSAPKDEAINIYQKPLVDELSLLSTTGVQTYDAFKKETFTLKAKIILQVHDFPGQTKVFNGAGCGGKRPCPKCKAEGTYSKEMGKMIFRSGREFLDPQDPLRLDTQFPGGGTEVGRPLIRDFEEETVLAAVSGTLESVIKNTSARSKERRNAKAAHSKVMAHGGRKRCSEFDRLGNEEAGKIAFEGMHTIQGVSKRIHGVINGHKDGMKVRQHEKAINRFPGCEPDARGRLPDAPFTLSKMELQVADSRVAMITVPSEKGSLPKSIFGSCHTMKSHTWHLILTKGIYLYSLRGMLGNAQRIALFMFCHIMALATSRTVYPSLLQRISRHLHRSMVIMDMEFPETIKTILWHMIHHLPEFLESYGPIRSYWMFYFERMIHHHVSGIHNQRHPEAAIIHSYQVDALCALQKEERDGLNQDNDSASGCYFREKRGGVTWKGTDNGNGSIIWSRHNGSIYFGRIISFFVVTMDEEAPVKYANVHWFEVAKEEVESKLLHFKKNTHVPLYPAVRVEDIPDPVIYAEDAESIFVLDFLDKTRMLEILDWMDQLDG